VQDPPEGFPSELQENVSDVVVTVTVVGFTGPVPEVQVHGNTAGLTIPSRGIDVAQSKP